MKYFDLSDHTYFGFSFSFSLSLSPSPAGAEPPTNLVTSEVTHHSFRATWTAPDGPVDKYRVEYVRVAGGPTQQVSVFFLPSSLTSQSTMLCFFLTFSSCLFFLPFFIYNFIEWQCHTKVVKTEDTTQHNKTFAFNYMPKQRWYSIAQWYDNYLFQNPAITYCITILDPGQLGEKHRPRLSMAPCPFECIFASHRTYTTDYKCNYHQFSHTIGSLYPLALDFQMKKSVCLRAEPQNLVLFCFTFPKCVPH